MLLIDWYDKKNDNKNTHKKHKWFKIDKTRANGEYLAIEYKYLVKLKARGLC